MSGLSREDGQTLTKTCLDCHATKPLEDFSPSPKGIAGRNSYCKPCHNARSRATRERLYGGGREYHLRARYGLGQADVDEMLAVQGGRCAACGKPGPEHVDHDHETGKVRGLLCFNCNQALGNVRDKVQVLDSLGAYLAPSSRGYAPLRAYLPPPGAVIQYVPAVRHGRWS